MKTAYDLAAVLRFASTGELPGGHPGRADRLRLGAPVPVLHSPILEAAPAALCVICRNRMGHWRHGHAGRALERLRRRGGLYAGRRLR